MKTYSECVKLKTFKERFDYLKLPGEVGLATFGSMSYLRNEVYLRGRWLRLKNNLIIRDKGNDLGVEGHLIDGWANGTRIKIPIILHHINPITPEDIMYNRPCVYDPENLIICSADTHRAIHYGCYEMLADEMIERKPNDTIPWKA